MGLIGLQTQLDAAYAQLHALAEWVDELKRHFDAPGFAGVCMALEGGWDARGENA